MGDINQLYISGGGSTLIATDEMLAEAERVTYLSLLFTTAAAQLTVAQGYITYHSSSMSQVKYAIGWMNDAYAAAVELKSLTAYLRDQLQLAIEQYSETENNARAMATGLDALINTTLGSGAGNMFSLMSVNDELALLALLGLIGMGITAPPSGDPLIDLKRYFTDPENVARLRRMIETGAYAALSAGSPTTELAHHAAFTGSSGVQIPAELLLFYAGFAGMLTETGVLVRATETVRQSGPLTSTRDRLAAIPTGDGPQVRIDVIEGDGPTRYEVFVGGTQDFSPFAGDTAFDLTSNIHGVAGGSPASYEGVIEAMKRANIPPGAEVSLVGYSQGALIVQMVAASGEYNVVNALTAGSPGGHIILPPEVNGIIIEHLDDPVTALGGAQSNTDSLVVQRHAFNDSRPPNYELPLPGHDLGYYLETGAMVDDADSVKLRNAVQKQNDFSSGTTVTSTYYEITRTT
jgi:hypothetical protein